MASIPPSVRSGIEEALEQALGRPQRIERATPVGGGCINPSARLTTDGGEMVFAKWNPSTPPDFFATEAHGLAALQEAGGLRVPAVIGHGGCEGGEPGWLALEFIPQGRPDSGYGERLGHGLAELHRALGDAYGWFESNYIGSLPQSNETRPAWDDFWRNERILPQLETARRSGYFGGRTEKEWDDFLLALPRVLEGAEADGPSLLHGDLWGGNVYPGPEGEPVLIDPSVYHGHREVDLAMSELFGGFSPSFYRAYDEAWPVSPRYEELRRDAYQMYYLLVHVNLFGAGYTGGTMSAVRRVLGAL